VESKSRRNHPIVVYISSADLRQQKESDAGYHMRIQSQSHPNSSLSKKPSVQKSRTRQTPDPANFARAQYLPPDLFRHTRFRPALQRDSSHKLDLLIFQPKLAFRKLTLAQLDALALDMRGAGERHVRVRQAASLQRAVRRRRGHKTFEIDAFGNQGLDACGQLRGAREQVGPHVAVVVPEGVGGEGGAQGGEDVGEWGEGFIVLIVGRGRAGGGCDGGGGEQGGGDCEADVGFGGEGGVDHACWWGLDVCLRVDGVNGVPGHPELLHHSSSSVRKHWRQRNAPLASPAKANSRSSVLRVHSAASARAEARSKSITTGMMRACRISRWRSHVSCACSSHWMCSSQKLLPVSRYLSHIPSAIRSTYSAFLAK